MLVGTFDRLTQASSIVMGEQHLSEHSFNYRSMENRSSWCSLDGRIQPFTTASKCAGRRILLSSTKSNPAPIIAGLLNLLLLCPLCQLIHSCCLCWNYLAAKAFLVVFWHPPFLQEVCIWDADVPAPTCCLLPWNCWRRFRRSSVDL